jgi:hypothetical protein
MNMQKYLPAVALSLLIPISGLARDAFPRITPDRLEIQGTVNAVNLQDGFIVVDDWTYGISRNTRIHSRQAKAMSVDKLKVGTYIGFNAERGDSGRRYVHEIWILPPDSSRGGSGPQPIPR